jgi:hypothetical protein
MLITLAIAVFSVFTGAKGFGAPKCPRQNSPAALYILKLLASCERWEVTDGLSQLFNRFLPVFFGAPKRFSEFIFLANGKKWSGQTGLRGRFKREFILLVEKKHAKS